MSLRALIKTVERGDNRLSSHLPAEHEALWAQFYKAFDGSLDAALALHEALLPGWRLHHLGENSATSSGWFCYIFSDYSSGFAEAHDQPSASRAWLLAILRAVEAEPSK